MYVFLDSESFESYVPTLFYERKRKKTSDHLAILDNYNFGDKHTHRQTDGHSDSKTNPAQRAESMNNLHTEVENLVTFGIPFYKVPFNNLVTWLPSCPENSSGYTRSVRNLILKNIFESIDKHHGQLTGHNSLSLSFSSGTLVVMRS